MRLTKEQLDALMGKCEAMERDGWDMHQMKAAIKMALASLSARDEALENVAKLHDAAAARQAAAPDRSPDSGADGMPEYPTVWGHAGHSYIKRTDYDALRQWALRRPEGWKAIWLRREDRHWIVSVEAEPGRWVDVIREFADAPASHIVEPSGIAKAVAASPEAGGRG